MKSDTKEYEDLVEKMEGILMGEKLDNVIPALTALLANAMAESETNKRACITYVVNTIDSFFERKENEKNNL